MPARVGEGEWRGVRLARTRAAAARLRVAQADWFAGWKKRDAAGRHRSQLALLAGVLGAGMDAVDGVLSGVEVTSDGVYRRCREVDVRLSFLDRLWAHYREKLDQRLDASLAPTLAAADDLVWACHAEAFDAATPHSLPVAFLDEDWSPRFLPRDRAPAGMALAETVRELPLAVISLPRAVIQEPWWLVLAAHEVGHHVMYDLSPDGALRAALVDALPAAWQRTADEIFADAFAVVALGAAPAWALAELEYATGPEVFKAAGRYPAPAVRLALLHEVARQAGVDLEPLAGLDAASWKARGAAAELDDLPAIATTLLELPVGDATLRGLIPGADFAAGGRAVSAARAIADGLGHAGDPGTRETRVVAAAVALAYRLRGGAAVDDAVALIRAHADPATRAAAPLDAATHARRLVARLAELPVDPE